MVHRLDEISAELILLILEFLGPGFFRKDIRRFTLSKRWYEIAWPFFIQNLELTSTSLVSFVDLMSMSTSAQDHDHDHDHDHAHKLTEPEPHARILRDGIRRNSPRSLTLLLDGWGTDPLETRVMTLSGPGGLPVPAGALPRYSQLKLEEYLEKLGGIFQGGGGGVGVGGSGSGSPSGSGSGIQELKVVARIFKKEACNNQGRKKGRGRQRQRQQQGRAPQPHMQTTWTSMRNRQRQPRIFLDKETVINLLGGGFGNLTSLEIDFPPEFVLSSGLSPGPGVKGPHVCEAIRGMLPRLRRLWVRLPEVCACLLESEGDMRMSTGDLESFGGLESLQNLESLVVVLGFDPAFEKFPGTEIDAESDGDGEGEGEGEGKGDAAKRHYFSKKCYCEGLHDGHQIPQMCFAFWRLGRRIMMKNSTANQSASGKRKVARVVWPSYRSSMKACPPDHGHDEEYVNGYEWVSFDGLTGKLMVLEGLKPVWDAEGEERIPGRGHCEMSSCYEDVFDERSSWAGMLGGNSSSSSEVVDGDDRRMGIPERWPHLSTS